LSTKALQGFKNYQFGDSLSDSITNRYDEILKIILSYANSGATSDKLANLYETLTMVMPNQTEGMNKEEEILNRRILSIIAGKDLGEIKVKEKERNVTEDVRRWVTYTTGEWYIGNMYSDLSLKEKKEKDTARHAVLKMVEDGKLENSSKRSGNYRKIEQIYKVMNIAEAEGKPIAGFRYPMGIEKHAKTMRSSVITVNGFPNQGKSAFVFEIARMNRHLFKKSKVRFMSSEAGPDEIKEKLLFYPQDLWPLSWWLENIDFIEQYDTWWDVIDPDGLNIIDYVYDNLENYKISHYISEIHKKLNRGIAVVVLQRDPSKPNSYGGQATRHDTRLAIDIEYKKVVLPKIKGAIKYEPDYRHPDGIARNFELKDIWKILPTSEWYWPEDAEKVKQKEKLSSYGVAGVGNVDKDEDFVHEK
jgi:hypothetical protein